MKATQTAKKVKAVKTSKVNYLKSAQFHGITEALAKKNYQNAKKFLKYFQVTVDNNGIYCIASTSRITGYWDWHKAMPNNLGLMKEYADAGLSPQDASCWLATK